MPRVKYQVYSEEKSGKIRKMIDDFTTQHQQRQRRREKKASPYICARPIIDVERKLVFVIDTMVGSFTSWWGCGLANRTPRW